jgi:MoxR-like ATPase
MPRPFLVMATQNPIEYEGTFPLPEAQLDRFLMKVLVAYPSPEKELGMLETLNALGEEGHFPYRTLQRRAGAAQIAAMRGQVHQVEADRSVLQYITDIVRGSRDLASVALGASPRAAVMMLHAAKALSLIRGNSYVRPDEVQSVAPSTLRHRLTLTPEAQIEGLTADDCISQLLRQVPVPR